MALLVLSAWTSFAAAGPPAPLWRRRGLDGASAKAEPRVILVSWDGAGYAMASRLLREGALPNLERMIREGAWSDGVVSSFPTKTAAAHAMLFTGQYGHTSGITGNSLWRLPAAEHDRLETENGYFSTALRVEPLWIMAAKAGRVAFAFHATQAYPFDGLERLTRAARERLFLIHGYTEVDLRGESFDERSVSLEDPKGWAVPESRGPEARAFSFGVGDTAFRGLFFDDDLDPAQGVDTLGIVRGPEASEFEARVKPGADGRFSVPIAASASGTTVWFSVRLFELSPDGGRFLVYRSGAARLALSNRETPQAGLPVMQVFSGNGATGPYSRGRLGTPLARGGDGTAEARLLETEAQLQRQLIRQARVALDEPYSLLVLYSPVTDDVAHELAGYLDPALDGYDKDRASRLWESVTKAFQLQDRFLGVLMGAAERDGAHVLVVSDHGMAATDRLVHLNAALAKAGLLSLRPDRSIDLEATRALAPPLSDGSVAVNTTDRLGGIVAPEDKEAVLGEVRAALEALSDPETGEPIVTAFFEPANQGLLQPGGASTGDLFLDFAPGYYPSTSTEGTLVVEKTEPRGNHIFVPTRRDMLAICAVWGPRIPAGANFGRIRAIDIAPTVLDLLGMEVPLELPGRSLVPARSLLHTVR